jgi:hypothetical protein
VHGTSSGQPCHQQQYLEAVLHQLGDALVVNAVGLYLLPVAPVERVPFRCLAPQLEQGALVYSLQQRASLACGVRHYFHWTYCEDYLLAWVIKRDAYSMAFI